ncbi:MAG: hypothetical protein WD030_10985 [Pirellulales bacterium]
MPHQLRNAGKPGSRLIEVAEGVVTHVTGLFEPRPVAAARTEARIDGPAET